MEKYIAIITALIILTLFSPSKIYAQSSRKAAEYTREAEYYQKKADGYRREAEYYQKKAEGYEREASYYQKKAEGYERDAAWDNYRTQMRYAGEASEKASYYLRLAAQSMR